MVVPSVPEKRVNTTKVIANQSYFHHFTFTKTKHKIVTSSPQNAPRNPIITTTNTHPTQKAEKTQNSQIPAKNNGRSRRRQYCANKTPNPAGIWREDVSSAITDILASGFLEGDATLHADFISLFPPSLFTSVA